MSNEIVKSAFCKYTPIEDTAWKDFEQHFSAVNLKKYDILWKEGLVCRHLVFITYGLIRSYRQHEDKETTSYFYVENDLFYDDYSFISQKPCLDTYEALEETALVLIPKAALDRMFDNYKSFERLGRIAAERNYVKHIENLHQMQRLSAEEKYLRFISQYPRIEQRVMQKTIASYLNITPEHLSKVRKSLMIKTKI